jgi:hypothetical protein
VFVEIEGIASSKCICAVHTSLVLNPKDESVAGVDHDNLGRCYDFFFPLSLSFLFSLCFLPRFFLSILRSRGFELEFGLSLNDKLDESWFAVSLLQASPI